MRIISWFLIGLIAGLIGNKIANRNGAGIVGLLRDLLLGVFGAEAGGYLFEIFGFADTKAVNLWSLPVAALGAIIVLLADHVVRVTVSKRRNLFPSDGDEGSLRD